MGRAQATGGWGNRMRQEIIAALTVMKPLFELFITIVGPVIITWLSAKAAVWLDIKNQDQKADLEAKIRFALHEAAERALTFAMAKYGLKIGTDNLSESLSYLAVRAGRGEDAAIEKVGNIVDAAVNEYLKPKMTGTIAKLGASDADLADIVMAKIPRV